LLIFYANLLFLRDKLLFAVKALLLFCGVGLCFA